jgi:hypothetical protein
LRTLPGPVKRAQKKGLMNPARRDGV